MCDVCESLSLLDRAGPKPRTNPVTPHMQLDQVAPAPLRERLIALGAALPGVHTGRSGVSIPASTALLLAPEWARKGAAEAFMAPGEFAHVHAAWDGSAHMNLPLHILDKVFAAGWGEPHPIAGRYGFPATIAMVYGPRDESEFATVAMLLKISHAFASGGRLPN